ncbi:hypothetical protein G7046_g3115 [Stylonectria norvegica]|nr:hypothetical protein G7046_g3115 [Stylonectria norvegica]
MASADQEGGPPRRSSSLRRRGDLQFVHVFHPMDAKAWKHQVRSHASRNPRARQQRVIQYQRSALKAQDIIGSIARRSVTCLPFAAPGDEAAFRLGTATHWARIAVGDVGMMATIFLIACRNLAMTQNDDQYTTLALQYKGECIARLNDALSQKASLASDTTIIKTLALACEAAIMGDKIALMMHLDAAQKMVEMRGGIKALGKNGFLGKLVIWFIKDPDGDEGSYIPPATVIPVAKTVAGFIDDREPAVRTSETRNVSKDQSEII